MIIEFWTNSNDGELGIALVDDSDAHEDKPLMVFGGMKGPGIFADFIKKMLGPDPLDCITMLDDYAVEAEYYEELLTWDISAILYESGTLEFWPERMSEDAFSAFNLPQFAAGTDFKLRIPLNMFI